MKDTLINVALFVVALMIILGATWHFTPKGSEGDGVGRLSAEELIKVIKEREVIDSTVVDGTFSSTVRYAYLGDPLPAKLHEDEILSLRTTASYSIQTGVENKGTEDEKVIMSLVAYPQDAFIQRDGMWYYIEHAEAPQDIFERVTKRHRVLHALFGNTVYAITDTVYSGAGDGHVVRSTSVGWDDVHDGTSGTDVATSSVNGTVGASKFTYKETTTWTIYRMFLPFVTSSIPSDATITSATLNVYVETQPFNADNDGLDYITVVQTDQATHTTLVLADYNNAGATNNPTEGIATGQRKDLMGMATGTLSFTLNATGLGWIKKSGQSSACSATAGISCFGLRQGHDTADLEPSGLNSVRISLSETSGTTQDPYLSVTYTVPPKFAFWMFSDF